MDKNDFINPQTENCEAPDVVETFFANPEMSASETKESPKRRSRAGTRKENLHLKNLEKSGACVETVVRSANKSYKKLVHSSYNDDGFAKSEVKKSSSRNIRHTKGVLPSGSAYKKGSEVINNDENSDE